MSEYVMYYCGIAKWDATQQCSTTKREPRRRVLLAMSKPKEPGN